MFAVTYLFSGLFRTGKPAAGNFREVSNFPEVASARMRSLSLSKGRPEPEFPGSYSWGNFIHKIAVHNLNTMANLKGNANRLINATSPYLLQHAYNPVDWYEWGEEALARAAREHKPILVSIGYSSCHWCHVMEREVFEKEAIARIMNEHLVCIKVDREERPDIDQIYMEAVQAMGVSGGWPLNVFLTPEQKPFYGGTYFAPDQWTQVIQGIHQAFTNRRSDIEASASELAALLNQNDNTRLKRKADEVALKDALATMYGKLQPAFDTAWGGLAKAPKFIMPSVWRWLLRYHHITGNEEARAHLVFTLKKIAMGGIYDQIGGGFARYSVDSYWFVPHFEKMLYDNAQLMTLYAEAYALTKDEQFKTVLYETFEWLQTEMTGGEGGFYSALDADSEGEEGRFYVWKTEELRAVTGADADLIADYFSIKENGNWEPDKNILMRVQQDEDFLKKHGLSADEWKQKLRRAKDKLLSVRDARVRPGLDDKIVTGWNAMMITGLVDTYKVLGDKRFLDAALRNMRFLENALSEGLTFYRSHRNKRSEVKGFLDDYAWLIRACIGLYEVTFDSYWIHRAKALTGHTLGNFFDKHDGFFHYAGKDAEKLIASRKEMFDNVIPGSNSVMAQNLFHLGIFFDDSEWKTMAEEMTLSLGHLITSEPNYMSHWGIVYAEIRHGMAEVVFAGTSAAAKGRELFSDFQPFALAMGAEGGNHDLPLLEGKTALNDQFTVYVCYNKTCQRPVHRIEDAREQLYCTPTTLNDS